MVCYGGRPKGDRSRDRDSRWLSILTLSQNREFPQYMQELKGMADGAQVDFAEALMYTMEEEFSYLVPEELRYSLADHCSDVLIREDDQRSPCLLLTLQWSLLTTKTVSTLIATAPSFST